LLLSAGLWGYLAVGFLGGLGTPGPERPSLGGAVGVCVDVAACWSDSSLPRHALGELMQGGHAARIGQFEKPDFSATQQEMSVPSNLVRGYGALISVGRRQETRDPAPAADCYRKLLGHQRQGVERDRERADLAQ